VLQKNGRTREGATEEAQTLLSKTNENYSIQNTPARFYIESQVIK